MRTLITALLLVFGTTLASAHDKPVKAPNGGQMIHLGDAHYELLARDNSLTLFISDEDNKPRTSLDGTKASATVLSDGKTGAVEMTPATPDTLTGTGSFVAKPGMRVVVSIQEPGRKPVQIRFTPAE